MNIPVSVSLTAVFLSAVLLQAVSCTIVRAADSPPWGEEKNDVQMAATVHGVEKLRELFHGGRISSIETQNLPLDLSIKNEGSSPMIVYQTGLNNGVSFYTLDDQGNRDDLTEPGPGGATRDGISGEIKPGETHLTQAGLSLQLLAQAKNGLYAAMKFSEVNSTNYFEVSTADLKISGSVLTDLVNGPNWGSVANGVRIAIEVPYVDNLNDFKNLTVVPVNIYVEVVGDEMVQAPAGDAVFNTVFVTQNGHGENQDINLPPPAGSMGLRQIVPGKRDLFHAALRVDSLNDVHGNLSVRVPLYHDFSGGVGKPFDVESAPIDARLINDLINAVSAVAPKLTPIPEENLNPLPGAADANAVTTPGTATNPTRKSVVHKPPAKPAPTLLAQVESSSYTMLALIVLGMLVIVRFFFRRRK